MEEANVITQLMGAVDTTKLVDTVTSVGVIVAGVAFALKSITFVKRLIGKI